VWLGRSFFFFSPPPGEGGFSFLFGPPSAGFAGKAGKQKHRGPKGPGRKGEWESGREKTRIGVFANPDPGP